MKPVRESLRPEARDAAPKKSAVRFRLLPITLSLLGLMVIQKSAEVYTGVAAIASANAAEEQAKEEAEEKAKEASGDAEASKETEKDSKKDKKAKKEDDGHGGGSSDKKEEEAVTEGRGRTTLKEIKAVKERQAQERFTPTELEILQSLKVRREALDAREKEIEMKLKVLDVAEDRLAERMNEMRTLEQELKITLAHYEDKQDGEIRGLVKIYENMKPVSAAGIFNEMDMPILLAVIDKMSERKVAPVLASMDPKKAREVTEELAEMRKLQRLKSEQASQILNQQPAP